jgi:transcription elongation GreA/GreB family factor
MAGRLHEEEPAPRRVVPITETAEAVTISRADFERLLDLAEDALDHAAIDAQEARERELGKEAARADYLSIEAVERMLAEDQGQT